MFVGVMTRAYHTGKISMLYVALSCRRCGVTACGVVDGLMFCVLQSVPSAISAPNRVKRELIVEVLATSRVNSATSAHTPCEQSLFGTSRVISFFGRLLWCWRRVGKSTSHAHAP